VSILLVRILSMSIPILQKESVTVVRPLGRGYRILIIAVGIIALITSISFVARYYVFITNGATAQGSIITVSKNSSDSYDKSGSSAAYSLAVAFTAVDGKDHSFTGSIVTNTKPRDGQIMAVIYNKADPQEAILKPFINLLVFPTLFSVFGIIFILLGIFKKTIKMRIIGRFPLSGSAPPQTPQL